MNGYTDDVITGWLDKLRAIIAQIPALVSYIKWVDLGVGVGIESRKLVIKMLTYGGISDVTFNEPSQNELFAYFRSEPFLAEKYAHELATGNFRKLRPIYLDIQYNTSFEGMKRKYPDFPDEFLKRTTSENLRRFGKHVTSIQQSLDDYDIDPDNKKRIKAVIEFFEGIIPYLNVIEGTERYLEIIRLIDELMRG